MVDGCMRSVVKCGSLFLSYDLFHFFILELHLYFINSIRYVSEV